jgi:hypothetical protein
VKRMLNAAIIAAALLAVPLGVMGQPPNAPFAAQAKMTCAQALKEIPKDDPVLATLAKSVDAEGARLKKSPKDARVKKAYVDTAIKYEQKIYLGQSKLSPVIKYRATLALCRMVLAVDPKNTTCKNDMDQIVQIYRGMNKPIPQ